MESLRMSRPLQRKFQIKWNRAEEDFLAHIHGIGPGGGFNAALLVGRIRDNSHRVCKLVGGISKRLVL